MTTAFLAMLIPVWVHALIVSRRAAETERQLHRLTLRVRDLESSRAESVTRPY